MNVFDEMGTYWAQIADEDQTKRQLCFLKNQLPPSGYVLDLACGTGRHSIPLGADGYGVVGLDVSVKLLKIAKQRSSAVEVVLGDMRFLPFKSQAFAAAISMDTSLGYLPSQRDDLLSLNEARRVLRCGGVFVVDVFNREQLLQKYTKEKSGSFEYPTFYLHQNRQVTQKGDALHDEWVVRDKASGHEATFQHTVRLYESAELQNMLQKAGFVVRQVYGDYEKRAFSVDSKRLILVACGV